MSRVSITRDGHVIREPEVVTQENKYGREEVVSETAFSPAPVHLAYDPTTGVVYAGLSEDEAVNGPADMPDTPVPTVEAAPPTDEQIAAYLARQSAPPADVTE